jgi:hypothetical protein
MKQKTEQRKSKSDFFSSFSQRWLRGRSNQRGRYENPINTTTENVRSQVVYFPMPKDCLILQVKKRRPFIAALSRRQRSLARKKWGGCETQTLSAISSMPSKKFNKAVSRNRRTHYSIFGTVYRWYLRTIHPIFCGHRDSGVIASRYSRSGLGECEACFNGMNSS